MVASTTWIGQVFAGIPVVATIVHGAGVREVAVVRCGVGGADERPRVPFVDLRLAGRPPSRNVGWTERAPPRGRVRARRDRARALPTFASPSSGRDRTLIAIAVLRNLSTA